MSDLLSPRSRVRMPSPPTAFEESSPELSTHQGSLHSNSPLLSSASDILRHSSPALMSHKRIVSLEDELKGSKQDVAQLEEDVTRLTKELRFQRRPIIVLERGEKVSGEVITDLIAENEELHLKGSASAHVHDLETRIGAFAADRKRAEVGIIENVTADMDTMIEAVHDLKDCICKAVRAQFAAGAGQTAEDVECDARGHLERSIRPADKSSHSRIISRPGSEAGVKGPLSPFPDMQSKFGTCHKPPGVVPKDRPQREDTPDYAAFWKSLTNPFSKTYKDKLYGSLDSSLSIDHELSRVEPPCGMVIGNLSDSDFSITTALALQVDKSLTERPSSAENTKPLSLNSSMSDDNVIPMLSPGRMDGLLRKSATPESPISFSPRKRGMDNNGMPSNSPRASNRSKRLRGYDGKKCNFLLRKRTKTDM